MERSESAGRARAALRAWRERPSGAGPYTRATPTGEVRIEALRLSGEAMVEVTVGDPENGDPRFRVVNPPTLVGDGAGGWVEDPLAALAQVIGEHGGTRRRRKRGQR